jgi:hypothetical protein
MTLDQLPPRLRVEGVKLVQPGEQPKETIKFSDAQIEHMNEVFRPLLDKEVSA